MIKTRKRLERKHEVKDLWHIWSLYLSALLSHEIRSRSTSDPLPRADQERISSRSILSLSLTQRGHMTFGRRSSREGIGRGSTLTFWATDWLRQITWVGGNLLLIPSQSPPNPLPKSCDLSQPLIGLERSAPDTLPKFSKSLTFGSNSTSDDESDVLKMKVEPWINVLELTVSNLYLHVVACRRACTREDEEYERGWPAALRTGTPHMDRLRRHQLAPSGGSISNYHNTVYYRSCLFRYQYMCNHTKFSNVHHQLAT